MQRYVLQTTFTDLCNSFGLQLENDFSIEPNFNAAPGHLMPIIVSKNGSLHIENAIWDTNTPSSLFDKPTQSLKATPCVIPISGFYIWKETATQALPFYVRIHSIPILAIAGFITNNQDFRNRFTVLTGAANVLLRPITPYMPLILNVSDIRIWLKESSSELLKNERNSTLPIPDMTVFRVPYLVNDLANNNPELLQPIPKVRDEE